MCQNEIAKFEFASVFFEIGRYDIRRNDTHHAGIQHSALGITSYNTSILTLNITLMPCRNMQCHFAESRYKCCYDNYHYTVRHRDNCHYAENHYDGMLLCLVSI
jgi:hypothetical protein